MEIWKDFRFEAAHLLPNVVPGHPCGRMHGHSYRVRVILKGPVGDRTGWITDFAVIAGEVEQVIAEVDHRYLNDVIENPTAENLAIFFAKRLFGTLPFLSAIEVREGATTGVRYEI